MTDAIKKQMKKLRDKQVIMLKAVQNMDDFDDLASVTKIGDVDVSGWSDDKKVLKLTKLNAELTDISQQLDNLQKLEKSNQRLNRIVNPTGTGGDEAPIKSLGDLFVETSQYKEIHKHLNSGVSLDSLKVAPMILKFGDNKRGFLKASRTLERLKADFTTSAGWATPHIDTGRLVGMGDRPLTVLDLINTIPMPERSFTWWQETTRTPNVSEISEAASYPEATFVVSKVDVTLKKRGAILPITDEVLKWRETARAFVDQKLSNGIRDALQTAMVAKLIADLTGNRTTAKPADTNRFVALKSALSNVIVNGNTMANGIIIHPFDLDEFQTERAVKAYDQVGTYSDAIATDTTITTPIPDSGEFMMGPPGNNQNQTIWGIRFIPNAAVTQNTLIVGDFNYMRLWEDPSGIEIVVGFANEDFEKGRVSIRATEYAEFVIERLPAFHRLTAI